jgi:hypothetical protein
VRSGPDHSAEPAAALVRERREHRSDAGPADAEKIISAAQSSFLLGDQWTYGAALIAVVLGAALVFFLFPRKEKESELRAAYSAEDGGPAVAPPPDPLPVQAAGGS